MSISLSDLEKYLGIGNQILGYIAVAFFAAKVFEWITNSWAFANYMDRDHRVIKRAWDLKKLKPDDNSSGIFVREISLLEQKLRIRYSRRQFGRYLRMRFNDKASDAAMEKRSNPYSLRGMASILYYAVKSFCSAYISILLGLFVFVRWRIGVSDWRIDMSDWRIGGSDWRIGGSDYYDKKPGAPGILGNLWGLAKLVKKALIKEELAKEELAKSQASTLLWSIGLLIVIVFLLSKLIKWCWNRYLCGYAFRHYIRPSLEKETRDILVYRSARFHDPGYPKVVETFRNELVKLGNRQIVGPRVAGDLIGFSFPAAFLVGIFQSCAKFWPMWNEIFLVIAVVITIFTKIASLSGFVMAIYFIAKMDEILPSAPIGQSDASK